MIFPESVKLFDNWGVHSAAMNEMITYWQPHSKPKVIHKHQPKSIEFHILVWWIPFHLRPVVTHWEWTYLNQFASFNVKTDCVVSSFKYKLPRLNIISNTLRYLTKVCCKQLPFFQLLGWKLSHVVFRTVI